MILNDIKSKYYVELNKTKSRKSMRRNWYIKTQPIDEVPLNILN